MINLDVSAPALSPTAALPEGEARGELQGREVKARTANVEIMTIATLAAIILPMAVIGGLVTGLTLLLFGVKPLVALVIGASLPAAGLIAIALPILGLSRYIRT